MKEIKIKLPEWKDVTKWFWDKFCFPRRKAVTEWIDYHNDGLRSKFEELLVKHGSLDLEKGVDMDTLLLALNEWDNAVEEITSRTRELIMMK